MSVGIAANSAERPAPKSPQVNDSDSATRCGGGEDLMLPLWHQEVLIMMMTGMERVPSDISNDLYSCNGEQVRIYILLHTHIHKETGTHTQLCYLNDASHNLLSSSTNPPGLTNTCHYKPLKCQSSMKKTCTDRVMSPIQNVTQKTKTVNTSKKQYGG